jgi:isopentenyl diphosphate isomerase/L-lactate dehydrogenase-like FMN-dependent dehydrogenase
MLKRKLDVAMALLGVERVEQIGGSGAGQLA